jgi:hypothetical protein
MTLASSYKNPFSEYNANVMDSKKILNYWCSPLDIAKASGVAESDIFSDNNPIIFMGGRGSGKTMFLKYHSFDVQVSQHAKEDPSSNLLEYLTRLGGIGFYIRIDGPVLRSFVGKRLTTEYWEAIFTHYFELQVCKAYLEVIESLEKLGLFKDDIEKSNFIANGKKILGIEEDAIEDCHSLLDRVDGELRYVNSFRAEVAFSDIQFHPKKVFASQDLVYGIPKIAKETIFLGHDLNFVIFIDEYENFQTEQQRIINTLIKFVKPGITFRIGMRLEGFRTFATVTGDEFVKEGRDYRKVVFEDILVKNKGYRDLLFDIARKRLESVPLFKEKGFTDIAKFLNETEDFEWEAEAIVKDSKKKAHFDILENAKGLRLSDEEIKLLYNADNPLMEMLNIVYALRGVKPNEIHQNMVDYQSKVDSKGAIKYKRDFIDKYKLSLLFLLAAQYRKNKMYYSFNTYAFLSSGIIGNFIELCRKAFQAAYFDDSDKLLGEGIIMRRTQDDVAKDLSYSELQGIVRIEEYGDMLHIFAKNMGNVFRSFHADLNITYPETIQFAVTLNEVDDGKYRQALNAALRWSIVQKKPRLQRIEPSKGREELYVLNRIFSPAFQISYRIRGGYSVLINSGAIRKLMSSEDAYREYVKKDADVARIRKYTREKQISLF